LIMMINDIEQSNSSINCRLKRPQPDNYQGLKAGKLTKVSDPVGLTLEGLQEWHDEACLAVLNNKYNDGIAWHDVSCHFR